MLKMYLQGTETVSDFMDRLAKDDDGASMVEYSVLIGLITVAAILAITAVGAWVTARWTALQTAIGA